MYCLVDDVEDELLFGVSILMLLLHLCCWQVTWCWRSTCRFYCCLTCRQLCWLLVIGRNGFIGFRIVHVWIVVVVTMVMVMLSSSLNVHHLIVWNVTVRVNRICFSILIEPSRCSDVSTFVFVVCVLDVLTNSLSVNVAIYIVIGDLTWSSDSVYIVRVTLNV